MSFLDWILNRVPQPAETEPTRPLPSDGAALEEVFVVADVMDSSGASLRYGLTLRMIAAGPDGPELVVFDHETLAVEAIPCAWVTGVIGEAGALVDCEAFLRDSLGAEIDALGPRLVAEDLREALRPALSVLVAAARADMEFPSSERSIVEAWLVAETGALADSAEAAQAAQDWLMRILPLMQPGGDMLVEHLAAVAQLPADRFARFVEALGQVVRADGTVSISEEAFLEEVALLVGAQG